MNAASRPRPEAQRLIDAQSREVTLPLPSLKVYMIGRRTQTPRDLSTDEPTTLIPAARLFHLRPLVFDEEITGEAQRKMGTRWTNPDVSASTRAVEAPLLIDLPFPAVWSESLSGYSIGSIVLSSHADQRHQAETIAIRCAAIVEEPGRYRVDLVGSRGRLGENAAHSQLEDRMQLLTCELTLESVNSLWPHWAIYRWLQDLFEFTNGPNSLMGTQAGTLRLHIGKGMNRRDVVIKEVVHVTRKGKQQDYEARADGPIDWSHRWKFAATGAG